MAAKTDSTQQGFMYQLRSYWPLFLVGFVVATALILSVIDRDRPVIPAAPVTAAPTTAVQATVAPAAVISATAVPVTAAVAPAVPEAQAIPELTMDQLLKGLLRQGIRPEGVFPTVDVLLAAPVYFAATGRNAPEDALREPSFLFYVTEDSHEELPLDPPAPMLQIDGREVAGPARIKVLADSFHHRTSLISYAAVDAQGQALVTAETKVLELVLPAPAQWDSTFNIMTWELPLHYSKDFSSWQVALGMPVAVDKPVQADAAVGAGEAVAAGEAGVVQGTVQTAQVVEERERVSAGVRQPLTWAAILAIMAGMLTALSPCLIQLVVYYTVTLAGASTEGNEPGSPGMASAQCHVLLTGIFFALGFTLVYTAGGAAAGFIGQSLDRLGILNTWIRPLSVVAGVIILFMALRVAWNARAPLVCHLPMTPIFGSKQRTGTLGSAVMGISFATGCLACFSATILPALLLYAGATGSVTYGALLLLVFSLGISLPCLALAFGVSRLQPLLLRTQKAGPFLGLASAVVMAGFGVIMVTNQFHLVSSLIYRFLGLS